MELYQNLYDQFKEHVYIINQQLSKRTYLNSNNKETIFDIYLCLTLIEMYQGLMDQTLKSKLHNLTSLFNNITSKQYFINRMGIIKSGTK